jgi:hypothetical protein
VEHKVQVALLHLVPLAMQPLAAHALALFPSVKPIQNNQLLNFTQHV